MSTRLLLIRHGQTTWNATHRWQGHSDPPLSELGRRQARDTAQSLASHALDALYASDLQRALETARIVGAPHGLEPVPDPRLRELDIGAWGGLQRDEIAARWPDALAAFDREDRSVRAGGGECFADLEERVRTALDDLGGRHAGETLAVVAHGGVLAAVTGEFGHANGEVVEVAWPLATP